MNNNGNIYMVSNFYGRSSSYFDSVYYELVKIKRRVFLFKHSFKWVEIEFLFRRIGNKLSYITVFGGSLAKT